jgi:hypothetical protein
MHEDFSPRAHRDNMAWTYTAHTNSYSSTDPAHLQREECWWWRRLLFHLLLSPRSCMLKPISRSNNSNRRARTYLHQVFSKPPAAALCGSLIQEHLSCGETSCFYLSCGGVSGASGVAKYMQNLCKDIRIYYSRIAACELYIYIYIYIYNLCMHMLVG